MNKPQATVDEVVERLTELAPPDWIRLVLNWEVTPDDDDDLVAGMAIFAIVRDDDEMKRREIDYDWTLGQCVDGLYWLMAEVNDRRWTTMHLEVDADRTRRVTFDYGDPMPLGSIDHQFDTYVEDHRSDLAALAPSAHVDGSPRESGDGSGAATSPGTSPPAGLGEQQELIETIVQRFAAIAPDGWARLAGNWEAYRDDDGRLTLNYITVAIVNGGHEWLYGQVGFDSVLYDAVMALNERMAGDDEQRRWTVFDLEVDADPAEFRVDFGYGVPKRVNGIDDHESIGRFRDYLQTWIDAHGPTP